MAATVSSSSVLVAHFLTPVPSGRLLTANNRHLPGSALETPCPSTHLHQWTPVSGWSMLGCYTYNLCKSHSILPATDWPLHFLLIALKAPPIFITAYFTAGEGSLPQCSNHFFPSAPIPQVVRIPSPFLFSFPFKKIIY